LAVIARFRSAGRTCLRTTQSGSGWPSWR
jgi:hypothetical protein